VTRVSALFPDRMDMSDSGPVRVEVFSDYTCPWCYVGWARLEQALGRLSEDIRVDVDWRPFEIHPEVPLSGMPVEELGYPPDVWARMQDALRASAAAEGLEVGNRPKVANTHRALLAGAWAQAERPESFASFHERLFVGYFAEGRDLGDPGVVNDLAASSGIDPGEMSEAIDGGAWDDALTRTTRDARVMGITGTPTFVFDRRFAASGAQPVEVLLRAFDAAVEARVSTDRA
jgi:predicted DsbA family dithiol-disulfide isomerase